MDMLIWRSRKSLPLKSMRKYNIVEASHCCEASVYNPADDLWASCNECKEMAEVLISINGEDFISKGEHNDKQQSKRTN